ncbi:DUF4352 domain-containing protein [Candidatus Saccharibacteria bacterium]|nr:MAG: DUF4352 domain-containing protein [Candidatus Saccharibacteria bacterium]
MHNKLGNNQSQVKTLDEKHSPRRNWERWLFGLSIVMLMVSFLILEVASSIASERIRVPFAGLVAGKPITTGTTTITVSDIHHKPGTGRFIARSGYEYLVLTLNVRNNGEKPLNVFPTTDTYIKTNSGVVSYVTPYDLANPFHSGSVLSGESTEGQLSYLVPKNASYKFYVESSWSGGAIPFMAQSEKLKRDNL